MAIVYPQMVKDGKTHPMPNEQESGPNVNLPERVVSTLAGAMFFIGFIYPND